MSSTFGCFSTARLGIYAAQKGLDVTGNNITNINTTGYTRQRLDQVSLVTTASDKYFSQYNTRVGQGVLTTGVSQLRDPGLDLLYRSANASVGSYDQMIKGLDELASILDEVGKGDLDQDDGVILNQMNDLRDLINQAVTHGIDGYDSLIRSSATALCKLFNKYATDLEELKGNYETYLEQDISRVNTILTSIRELNVSIRNADIRGDAALELRDQRNLLLDELSGYMKINVTYSMENVGAGLEVERLTVTLANDIPHNHTLIDGEYAAQLEVDLNDPTYTINLQPLVDYKGDPMDPAATALGLLDNDLFGSLQSLRELLTEKGEYATDADVAADPDAAIKRGIPYYQLALDSLAKEFAEVFNQTNQLPFDQVQNAYQTDAGKFVDAGGAVIQGVDENEDPVDLTADFFENHANDTDLIAQNMEILRKEGVLTDAYASYTGGPLFSMSSNGNDTSDITAANISISKDWADGVVSMVSSLEPSASSGDTSNLAAFLNLFSKDQAFNPKDIDADATGAVYSGSFEDMLLRIQSTLAEDQMTTSDVLNNYTITLNEAYTSRDSISGVDLNDEATNLMIYQKAYAAACRLMTYLDEALDALMAM